MRILGIETSADESSAAVVEDGQRLLSNIVASSMDLHAAYGGVVPEIAARSHLEVINPVIDQALSEADANWDDIDVIAVTHGPGLLGSLLIGVLAARTLALAKNKPLQAVNHVEAHLYAAYLTQKPPSFPFLGLIVSGGHSQLVLMKSHGDYRVVGRTYDDAVGEAFDKVAKMLGLPYPGGPSIAEAAAKGDALRYKFPTPQMTNPYDFSFSGLKTAVLRTAQKAAGKDFSLPSAELPSLLNQRQIHDLAASFQASAIKILVDKTVQAYGEFKPAGVVVAGGVAANQLLRAKLTAALPIQPIFPDIKLCTDNAAMVASLGYFQIKQGVKGADPTSLPCDPGLEM